MNARSFIIPLLGIFIFLGFAFRAAGGTDVLEPPAKLTASLDRKSARIGDAVILTLKYYVPEGIRFETMPKLDGLDGFTIIDKKKMSEGEIKLTLIVDKIDKFEIGPISLSYKDKDGVETVVRSEAVSIAVQSNLGGKPAEAQLKPIMDIVPIIPVWRRYLPWILGVILIAGLIFGIIWWRKRRQKIEEYINIKPPHVVAEEEIRKLQSLKIFEKGQCKDFYFRLSEIIRRYIEKMRNFPAVEFTTEEIARRLKSETDRKIIPLLRQADLVKFADTVPTQARKEEDVDAALSYIRDTAPPPSVAEEAAAVAGGVK